MGASHTKEDFGQRDQRRASSRKSGILRKYNERMNASPASDMASNSNSSRASTSSSAARTFSYPYPRGHSTLLIPPKTSAAAVPSKTSSSGIRPPTSLAVKRQPMSYQRMGLNIPSPVASASEPSTTENSANVSRSETREFVEEISKEHEEKTQPVKPKVIADALTNLNATRRSCANEEHLANVENIPSVDRSNSLTKSSPMKIVAFSNNNAKPPNEKQQPVLSRSLPTPRSILKTTSMELDLKPTVVAPAMAKSHIGVCGSQIARPNSFRGASIIAGDGGLHVRSSKSTPANLKGVAPLAESECFIVENSPAVEFPPTGFPSMLPGHQKTALPPSKLASKRSEINPKASSSSSYSKLGQGKAVASTKMNVSSKSIESSADEVVEKKSSSASNSLSNLASPSAKSLSFAEQRLRNSGRYAQTQQRIYKSVDVKKEDKRKPIIVEAVPLIKDADGLNDHMNLDLCGTSNTNCNKLLNPTVATTKRQTFAASKVDDSKSSMGKTIDESDDKTPVIATTLEALPRAEFAPSTGTSSVNASPKISKAISGESVGKRSEADGKSPSRNVLSSKHEMHDSGVKTSDTSGGSDTSNNSKVTSPDGSLHRGLIDDEIKDQPDLTLASQIEHHSSDQTLSGNETMSVADKGSVGPVRYRERVRKRSAIDRMAESCDSTISSASVDEDDLMLDFEGSVDFGESVDFADSLTAASLMSSRRSLKGGSWRKRSSATNRASLEVVMDEWNHLVTEVQQKNANQSQRLRSVSDAVNDSPTNGVKATRPLKPPSSLSIDCVGFPSITVDQHTYRHLIQDVTVLKTLLFRLKRVLQEADTTNPFESSMITKNGLLKTGIEEILGDQLSHEFTKDDLREENTTLRTQIALMRQQLEEKDKIISEQKQRILELERLKSISSQTKAAIVDVNVGLRDMVVNCDKMNGRLLGNIPHDSSKECDTNKNL